MNTAFKRILAGPVVAAAVACGSGAAQAEPLKIAAVSGYFSQGFGISIVNGLERAKKDLGVELKIVDTGNRALDYEEQFNNLAKGGQYDLIFVMGWELVDALQKSNKTYPDQRFIFIDGVLDSPTMTYIDFVEEEGSFLAGALAGMLTSGESRRLRQFVGSGLPRWPRHSRHQKLHVGNGAGRRQGRIRRHGERRLRRYLR
ncbi:BMP family lipoprotein [Sinorhizobium medicae]